MPPFLFWLLWILVGIALYLAVIYGIPYAFNYLVIQTLLAKNDYFITPLTEGHIISIDRNNTFKGAVVRLEHHDILDSAEKLEDYKKTFGEPNRVMWDVVKYDPTNERDMEFAKRWPRPFWETKWDVAWLGVPPINRVHEYKFSWLSPRQQVSGEAPPSLLHPHKEEMLRSILAQEKTYGFKYDRAENKDGAQFDLTVFFTWRCVNPFKALYGIESWLETVISKLKAGIKIYVGERVYDQLKTESGQGSQKDAFQKALEPVIRECSEQYGILITEIDIAEIEPAGQLAEDFVRASLQRYTAEEKRKAQEELAIGEAAFISKQAEAVENHGEAGRLVAIGTAFRNLPPGTTLAGSVLEGFILGRSQGQQPTPAAEPGPTASSSFQVTPTTPAPKPGPAPRPPRNQGSRGGKKGGRRRK